MRWCSLGTLRRDSPFESRSHRTSRSGKIISFDASVVANRTRTHRESSTRHLEAHGIINATTRNIRWSDYLSAWCLITRYESAANTASNAHNSRAKCTLEWCSATWNQPCIDAFSFAQSEILLHPGSIEHVLSICFSVRTPVLRVYGFPILFTSCTWIRFTSRCRQRNVHRYPLCALRITYKKVASI